MRPIIKSSTIFQQSLQKVLLSTRMSFTGDAITYLQHITDAFNLNDWIWHTEMINGEEWYIITDKKNTSSSGTIA